MSGSYKAVKRRVFDIIQIGQRDDLPSRMFDWGLSVIIIVNIVSMFMQTFDVFEPIMPLLDVIEAVTLVLFCVEYVLRIWTADLLYPDLSPAKARLRFLVSFDGIIDLCTILPFFYLSGFIAFRMLRVGRIFHLFRINSVYDSFNIITTVLYEKRNQILSSLFIIIILLFASSLGMYSAEHDAQPNAFKNAFSGIWWSVSTLLTVGYGDIYPVTIIGRIMAICIAFLGVGVVAIPTGIISAGFVEQYSKRAHAELKLHDISEVGEILIDGRSEFLGRRIAELKSDYELQIFMLLRDGLTIIPADNIETKENDILIVSSEKMYKKKHTKKKSRG
ncbi:MAG: ion transporter [Ruminococcus sp.]|nr:ion transporter [Ruminococcus sp.]